MMVRLLKAWESLRTSYWFLPSLMSAAAVALSFIMVDLDARLVSEIPVDAWWIYGGGAAGARAVLSVIAGSMISVTSIVFSITIVALTLASGQFGSRLLRSFMQDRANQIVLGVFIATFIYALLIMRSVQGVEAGAFVPPLSITLAVVLVFVSIGFLIFFIHHIALSIQADEIVAAIFGDTSEAIETLYPVEVHDGVVEVDDRDASRPSSVGQKRGLTVTGDEGYLQLVDTGKLLKLAVRENVVVELTCRPGDWIGRSGSLARVVPSPKEIDATIERVQRAFVLGNHRTLPQDAEFGFLQLVEVAVRALSPGINDPFTAITCIDHLSALLQRLAERPFPSRFLYDRAGHLRLIADTPTFDGFVDTAFNQIRQNAGGSVAVLIRMLEGIENVLGSARTTTQRTVLLTHADLIVQAGECAQVAPRDMSDIRDRRTALGHPVVQKEAAPPGTNRPDR